MFNKLEFSDLYKFLTSVGLILIATSFIVPWLFMGQDIFWNIKENDFKELIKASKDFIQAKSQLQLIIISIVPWVSLGLFIIGGVLVVFGIYKWHKKQVIVDMTEEMNFEKLFAEMHSLKPEEVSNKAAKEVEEELTNTNNSIANKVPEKSDIEKSDLSKSLVNMENIFYQKYVDYNTFDYKLEQNITIANTHEIDILLTSYNQSKRPDQVIEIKYFQNRLHMDSVHEAYRKIRGAINLLRVKYHRNAVGVLIIVYNNKIANDEEIKRFRSAVFELLLNKASVQIKWISMADNEVDKYNIKNLIEE